MGQFERQLVDQVRTFEHRNKMISKMLYASIVALLVSGCAAEHHAETYVTNAASASASSFAEPGFVSTETETSTYAEGDHALAEAGALALASGRDWWGEGADSASLSESVTLIEDGGIFVGALAEDEVDISGDWEAEADAEAFADGYVHVFKKYWEPEPHPGPEPHDDDDCDSWWCEPPPPPPPPPPPCDSWWCDHEEDSGEDGGVPGPDDDEPAPTPDSGEDDDEPAPEPTPSDNDSGAEPEPEPTPSDNDSGAPPSDNDAGK